MNAGGRVGSGDVLRIEAIAYERLVDSRLGQFEPVGDRCGRERASVDEPLDVADSALVATDVCVVGSIFRARCSL